MAAPTTAACVKKTLANLEPSTHGPSPTCRGELAMSAHMIAKALVAGARECRVIRDPVFYAKA
ncbi:hypothetical protein, partial [Bradyrhizobium liaoningense]|uniref:hypothetical protein n=1 Tax=Bradyrhizobium liaoningense TaxID=43992 RepID=UPI001BAE4A33